ncbi:MAG: DUF1592 domain-containing protein [Acidobacteriota bacterium]
MGLSSGVQRLCRRSTRPERLLGVGCIVFACAVVNTAAVAPSQAPRSPAAAVNPASGQRALLNQYCVGCHNQRMMAAAATPIALDTLDLARVPDGAERWEKVVLKLRAGLMPPAGRARPDKAVLDGFASWLEDTLDRASAAHPDPGRPEPFHRLNRSEYQNAVRDLLAVNVDVAGLLPSDDVSAGFDNIANVLTVSPTLMDRYLAAAQKISRLAVGASTSLPNVEYYRVADDLGQDDHLPDMPFGTRGGTKIHYLFPTDGEYAIRVKIARDLNDGVPVYTENQDLEVSIDGRRLQIFTLPGGQPPAPRGSRVAGQPPPEAAPASADAPGGRAGGAPPQAGAPSSRELRNHIDDNWQIRIPVTAGEHAVVVAFLKQSSAIDETPRLPFLRPYPAGNNVPESRMGAALRSVEISGPYEAGGASLSPSRQRIYLCSPVPSSSAARGSSAGSSDAACARRILTALARRAYRRPVASADVEPLLTQFQEAASQSGFDAGVERAIRRLLVSPEFLYRVELDPPNLPPNSAYRVSDLELASRLSFFLWSSIPDDELLELAAKRQLKDRAVLAGQVRRMMADPRSDAFTKNFAGQWLFLRNLPVTGPAQSAFPDFDDNLRQAFRRETELFFDSIVHEDRNALDLLRADYTFLNERLALHYGVATVKGSRFRRYTWDKDSVRGGLLGQGSILTVTSYPDRTSPVVRGKWILENLLGTPPPPPLPNVGDLKSTDGGGAVLSMRERLAQHRANPVCAGCHSMMDPIGLALENFDGVGHWRTRGESSVPIDASAMLPDGTKFDGPDGLKRALLARSDRFLSTVVDRLLTYAVGRKLEYYDMPAIRAILRQAAPNDYRFTSALVLGVVSSAPFQMRRTAS